jgi:hypothetical protein
MPDLLETRELLVTEPGQVESGPKIGDIFE